MRLFEKVSLLSLAEKSWFYSVTGSDILRFTKYPVIIPGRLVKICRAEPRETTRAERP